MSLPAMLAMLTGGAGAGGALPPLGELLNIKCAVCIDTMGPDARQATTLAHGTLTCDSHAAVILYKHEDDSDNLATVRELLEKIAARLAEHMPTDAETLDAYIAAEATAATLTAATRDSDSGHRTPCGVAQCVACYPTMGRDSDTATAADDSDSDTATGAGQ